MEVMYTGYITYTCHVNHGIYAPDSIIKDTSTLFKIIYPDKVELRGILWPVPQHGFCLCRGASSTPDFDAAVKQLINDMSANESRRPCD